MKKKLAAMLLAVIMAVSLLPGTAWAATSGSCGDNVTWSYSNGTLTIQGTGPMKDYKTDNDNNYALTPWVSYCGNVHTIIIGEGVTSIGARAFRKCTASTSVVDSGRLLSIILQTLYYIIFSINPIQKHFAVTFIADNTLE